MILAAQRTEATTRLAETKLTLDLIISNESTPPQQDSLVILNLRGLFFVQLYACLEFSINAATQKLLNEISAREVQYCHFCRSIYAIVLDPKFASIKTAGRGKKWSSRTSLISHMFSNDSAQLSSGTLYEDQQNIKASSIEELFLCLGIDSPALPRAEFIGHIDTITDNRNAVAHGRKTAAEVAAGHRSNSLRTKWDIVSETISHVYDRLEKYLQDLEFIHPSYRFQYLGGV